MENSPSLKLKIKLGPNMKAESASPRVLPTKEEEENNPLKIIIKKVDLPSNAAPAVADRVTLTLLAFPNVAGKPMFKKACSCTSFEQLEKWSEKDLAQLGDELDSMRKTFKEFSGALQVQLEMLETWRQKSDPTKNKKTELPQYFPPKPQAQAFNLTANAPPGVVADRPPKSKSKKVNKKRKSQDSSSGDDPSFSVAAKESSSSGSDDEIDVVDIEENGGEPDAEIADPSKAGARAKTGAVDSNKKAQKNKLAMMIRKRNSGGGTRGRQKMNRISRQSTRERKKSRKGEELDSSAEEMSGKGGKWPNNNFWRDMEPFFSTFTQEDLKFCAPQSIDSEDAAFQIPPLGRHYSDEWTGGDGEDEEDYFEPVRQTRGREAPRPFEGSAVEAISAERAQSYEDRNPSCGDLTARILAALIEENVIPSNMQSSLSPEMEVELPDGDMRMTEANLDADSFPFKDPVNEGLPLETPPTYDYSHATMMSLEDRIKLELRSIGLLDDQDLDIDNHSREDDEICSELRKLQKELRDQILANNVIRAKVSALVSESMTKEEQQKKDKAANAQLEKTYLKLMRKKKRKPVVGKTEVT